MEQSLLWVTVVQIFLVIAYQGIDGASDRVESILDYIPTEERGRTAYHFQPPKNWMNGMSLTFLVSFLQLISWQFLSIILSLTICFLLVLAYVYAYFCHLALWNLLLLLPSVLGFFLLSFGIYDGENGNWVTWNGTGRSKW